MNAKINRIPLHLACAIVASLTVLPLSAQKAASTAKTSKRPALVVGIVIDGLDIDKIYQLRDHFGAGGFNRLINQGITISDLDYGSSLDNTAATAVIYTGSAPAVNGIPSSTLYDPATRRDESVMLDKAIMGNFTDETYSPKALRVSTLTDELRIDTGGLGLVHSIAAEPSEAIIMSGHAGNSAVWISDDTGKWASTTYYTELPTSIQTINHFRPLTARLDTLSWAPSLPAGVYDFLPSYKKIYSFRHTYGRNDPNRYKAYKTSAPANTEITSVAADYLKLLNMGKREPTDMLNISYTLQPYTYGRDADSRAELFDSYIRLDRDLERLFKSIDTAGPGMDRTLLFVAGTPLNPSTQRDDDRFRIPSGDFSPARAISLLKVYLISEFGNGDWVSGYHNGQIYLNRDQIRDRGKDLDQVRRLSADFLRRMSGVTFASTIDELITAPSTAETPFPPARNIDVDTAGDIFLAIAPGWRITDDVPQSRPVVVRSADSSSAAFILYPPLQQQMINTPVDARAIAPTVARLIHIRSPNGSQLSPLRF